MNNISMSCKLSIYICPLIAHDSYSSVFGPKEIK